MLMDPTRQTLTELRGTQLGLFLGVVREIGDVAWVLLFCGDRWAFVPRYLAEGFQIGQEVMLRCWETEFGICGKPLKSPIREGHTWRKAA